MSDFYFDAAAGRYRSAEDNESGIDERPEDDALVDSTEQDVKQDAAANDPEDDLAFREARRGQRELSGRVRNYGRRRGNHPTGFKGRGIRGLRVSDSADTKRIPHVRPTGRQLGGAALAIGRPSLDDAPELVAALLGRRRVRRLCESFAKRGATTQERADRVYLAVMLRHLDHVAANRAAADLLLGEATTKTLRKIGDLRRRAYDAGAVERATEQLRAAVGRRNNVRPRS